MLVVTHEMGFARDVSSRVSSCTGVVEEDGTPKEVFDQFEIRTLPAVHQQIGD